MLPSEDVVHQVVDLKSTHMILGMEVNHRHMCSYQQHIPLWKGPLVREHRNKFVQTVQERDHCNPVFEPNSSHNTVRCWIRNETLTT